MWQTLMMLFGRAKPQMREAHARVESQRVEAERQLVRSQKLIDELAALEADLLQGKHAPRDAPEHLNRRSTDR